MSTNMNYPPTHLETDGAQQIKIFLGWPNFALPTNSI